jgi:hypothetical protein
MAGLSTKPDVLAVHSDVQGLYRHGLSLLDLVGCTIGFGYAGGNRASEGEMILPEGGESVFKGLHVNVGAI